MLTTLPSRVAVIFLFGLILPMLLGLLFGILASATLALAASAVFLEVFAVPLAVARGLSPPYIWAVSVSCSIATFLLTMEMLVALRSFRWLDNLVRGVHERAERSALMRRYGIYALPLCAGMLTVQGCAALVWLSGWPLVKAVFLTVLGFAVLSMVVLLSTIGVFQVVGHDQISTTMDIYAHIVPAIHE